MNKRPLSYIFLPIFLIILLVVTFIASAYYTFAIGAPRPTPTPAVEIKSQLSSSPTPTPDLASQYADQAHFTDGILLWGIIIGAIIIVGVFYGRRMTG
jgi:polyferredoxin